METKENKQAQELQKFIEENVTVKKDREFLTAVVKQITEIPQKLNEVVQNEETNIFDVFSEIGNQVKSLDITEVRLAINGMSPEAKIIAESKLVKMLLTILFVDSYELVGEKVGSEIIKAALEAIPVSQFEEIEGSTNWIAISDIKEGVITKSIVNLSSYRTVEYVEKEDGELTIVCTTPAGSVDIHKVVEFPTLALQGVAYAVTPEFKDYTDNHKLLEGLKESESDQEEETETENNQEGAKAKD